MRHEEELRNIAFLECYIKEFKRPDWVSWFGFYEQKDRVKKAEKHLKLKQNNLFNNGNNAGQCGCFGYKQKSVLQLGDRIMQAEPKKAYVYQPLPPQDDGKFYGVGGLTSLALSCDDAKFQGVDKETAEEVVRICNEHPEFAASFIRGLKNKLGMEELRL